MLWVVNLVLVYRYPYVCVFAQPEKQHRLWLLNPVQPEQARMPWANLKGINPGRRRTCSDAMHLLEKALWASSSTSKKHLAPPLVYFPQWHNIWDGVWPGGRKCRVQDKNNPCLRTCGIGEHLSLLIKLRYHIDSTSFQHCLCFNTQKPKVSVQWLRCKLETSLPFPHVSPAGRCKCEECRKIHSNVLRI